MPDGVSWIGSGFFNAWEGCIGRRVVGPTRETSAWSRGDSTFEKRGENLWGGGTRPGCRTTSDPTARRLVPHPIQLEFRLYQGQPTNKQDVARGTHPKLWAAHEAEGQLYVAGVSEE